jgi:hypothetical protein
MMTFHFQSIPIFIYGILQPEGLYHQGCLPADSRKLQRVEYQISHKIQAFLFFMKELSNYKTADLSGEMKILTFSWCKIN